MKITSSLIKIYFVALIYIGTSLLVTSCQKQDSKDVNQDKIYTDYVVFYDKNDDKTHVVARFRFGNATGTLLNLTDSTGAKITFNGTSMPYNDWWSAHYIEIAGNVTSGTFSYTNTNGTTYTNTIPTGADTIAYPIGFDTIAKSSANTFTWGGSALAANQSVGIFVGTWTWAQDALFYTDADNATNIVFGVQSKSSLSTGQATVYMDRSITKTSINGTSVGGTIRYTYRPKNPTVTIVP